MSPLRLTVVNIHLKFTSVLGFELLHVLKVENRQQVYIDFIVVECSRMNQSINKCETEMRKK
jgi:hypothetical protein